MVASRELIQGWAAEEFGARRRFQAAARRWIRLPEAGKGPLEHLLPEAVWQDLLLRVDDPQGWLMSLSAATVVYFFPSREWPLLLVRYLERLKVKRLLEAGAGRGYLTGALASLAKQAGLAFKAIDKGEGEFQSSLPVGEQVEPGDVFAVAPDFQPDVILYAWPPPGQSLAPLLQSTPVRYLIVIGEPCGGATGDPRDWLTLPHRESPALGRFSRGRTGPARHRVTIFWKGP
jgi:hypothetical protein